MSLPSLDHRTMLTDFVWEDNVASSASFTLVGELSNASKFQSFTQKSVRYGKVVVKCCMLCCEENRPHLHLRLQGGCYSVARPSSILHIFHPWDQNVRHSLLSKAAFSSWSTAITSGKEKKWRDDFKSIETKISCFNAHIGAHN